MNERGAACPVSPDDWDGSEKTGTRRLSEFMKSYSEKVPVSIAVLYILYWKIYDHASRHFPYGIYRGNPAA